MSCSTSTDIKMLTQTQAMSQDAATIARQSMIKDAAEKFEGIMLEELLKPMQHAGSVNGAGFAGDGSDEDGKSSGGDPAIAGYSSYGVEAMAEALAKCGGLGIAKQVLNQIGKADEKNQEKSSSTKV